jgi:hypothetical protein
MPHIPNLFIPGAAKSATSYIYACLKKFPDIYAPAKKEMHYMAASFMKLPLQAEDPFKKYEKQIISEQDAYLGYYSLHKGQQYLLDCSPTYMMYPGSAKKIKEISPSAKIIILLRNPVHRSFSQYKMNVRINCEPLSFNDALAAENDRLSKDYFKASAYKSAGLYSNQVKAFIDAFGKEKVMFILYEDIASDPYAVFWSICNWLDIEFNPDLVDNKMRNYAGYPRFDLINRIVYSKAIRRIAKSVIRGQSSRDKLNEIYNKGNNREIAMDPGTSEKLYDFFSDDIKELSRLTHIDFSSWLDGKDDN